MSIQIHDAYGNPTTLKEDATYTVTATKDGETRSDTGVLAWQVRQALERAAGLGITLDSIIEEAPMMSEAEFVAMWKGGVLR